jgi:hypothetical protein
VIVFELVWQLFESVAQLACWPVPMQYVPLPEAWAAVHVSWHVQALPMPAPVQAS